VSFAVHQAHLVLREETAFIGTTASSEAKLLVGIGSDMVHIHFARLLGCLTFPARVDVVASAERDPVCR
jgi:hypothetical protein